MRTLIIIPAYNEAKNLPRLFKELVEMETRADILVINDCSRDDTEAVCKRFGVNVVSLPVNLGIGGAVQTGYKYAYYNDYDIAVQVDGDGQHDPHYIKNLLDKIEEGYNLCIGSRFIENEGFQSSRSRRAGIRYFSKLIKFFNGKTITDPTSGFRACDRELIAFFAKNYPKDYPEPETNMTVLKNKFKVIEVPVVMNARDEGQSSITSLKALYYMVKVSMAIFIAAIARKEREDLLL